ncbi:hypothetical protein SAMIE_1015760 [Sphingobium amiense]|uniref:Uncharacterized protein n=1 Tax=Sphingobium amiense TaxID=135719 RepID=A0A494WC29_9SPHN|nr:hypothetical protein [Sphingobium amiense]BBD98075.1 hypothetical protein SAMIE_1015760 [Sphingobium amiense]
MTREATYAAFDRAFANVSAYVILHSGAAIGRVAFKHGASVQCYAQIWGGDMQRGTAGGGGYDRATAAAEQAFSRMSEDSATRDDAANHIIALQSALAGSDGKRWALCIEDAGYTVQHVFG